MTTHTLIYIYKHQRSGMSRNLPNIIEKKSCGQLDNLNWTGTTKRVIEIQFTKKNIQKAYWGKVITTYLKINIIYKTTNQAIIWQMSLRKGPQSSSNISLPTDPTNQALKQTSSIILYTWINITCINITWKENAAYHHEGNNKSMKIKKWNAILNIYDMQVSSTNYTWDVNQLVKIQTF